MENLLMALAGILAIGFIWAFVTSNKRKSMINQLNGKVDELSEMISKLNSDLEVSSEEYKNVRMRNGEITIKYKSQIEQLTAKLAELQGG